MPISIIIRRNLNYNGEIQFFTVNILLIGHYKMHKSIVSAETNTIFMKVLGRYLVFLLKKVVGYLLCFVSPSVSLRRNEEILKRVTPLYARGNIFSQKGAVLTAEDIELRKQSVSSYHY